MDGTVAEVAEALIGSRAVLGVLPLGSVMNIARMLGVPRDLEGAIRVVKAGRAVPIDVGWARASARRRFFLEAAGGDRCRLFAYVNQIDHGNLRSIRTDRIPAPIPPPPPPLDPRRRDPRRPRHDGDGRQRTVSRSAFHWRLKRSWTMPSSTSRSTPASASSSWRATSFRSRAATARSTRKSSVAAPGLSRSWRPGRSWRTPIRIRWGPRPARFELRPAALRVYVGDQTDCPPALQSYPAAAARVTQTTHRLTAAGPSTCRASVFDRLKTNGNILSVRPEPVEGPLHATTTPNYEDCGRGTLPSAHRDGSMSTNDLGFASATDLARSVRDRSLSPVEIVDDLLARIERINQINTLVEILADEALDGGRARTSRPRRRSARAAARRPGADQGPDQRGRARGSPSAPLFADVVATEDAPIIARLRAAGAIILTTTMPSSAGKASWSRSTG